MKSTPARKIIKKFASLKCAVFVILAMGTMSAWGTIVESMYNDAKRAQETVYHSWYSYSIFILLSINLIAVIADRYPWKRHHIGFISAHVGIITLIAGSILTRYFGIDGSMAFNISETKNRVMVSNTDVIVYSGLASGGARKIFEEEVHFLKTPPSEESPYKIPIGNDEIVIDRFVPYTIPQNKIEPSTKETDGPGLRFQIANERVSESDWLLLGNRPFEVKNMGPARIVLAKKGGFKYSDGNVLLLETNGKSEELKYSVFTASKNGLTSSGVAKAGDSIQTGWMGLTFRLLKYMPSATRTWTYEPLETSVEQSLQAIRFTFNGKEYWTGLNSSVRLFTDQAFFVFVYANRQLDLDFALKLDEFRVGRYQGTRRAASYESDVSVVEKGKAPTKTTISMNE
ncbi:MAG: cytochrome c biogenesis protein, partial [Pseudomonadota bacterium]